MSDEADVKPIEDHPPSSANDAAYWRDKAFYYRQEAERHSKLAKERGAKLKEQEGKLARIDELEAENAELKEAAGGLLADLRERDHRAAFDRLAKKAGAHEDGLDDLWQLSGYEPADDKPDDKALGSLIDGLKESKKRFFGAQAPQGAPPPTGDRGAGADAGGKKVVTREQLADRAWNQANRELLADPSKWTLKD